MARRTKRASRLARVRSPKRIVRLPADYYVAMDLSNVIFPPLYQFENGLRLLLDSFLTTCYGIDWWDVSLRPKLQRIFEYAETQQKKLDSMPWIGATSTVKVLPIHLVTLGHLEEVVKAYQSDCIPDLYSYAGILYWTHGTHKARAQYVQSHVPLHLTKGLPSGSKRNSRPGRPHQRKVAEIDRLNDVTVVLGNRGFYAVVTTWDLALALRGRSRCPERGSGRVMLRSVGSPRNVAPTNREWWTVPEASSQKTPR